jgi:PAS domain S-box-containing protein
MSLSLLGSNRTSHASGIPSIVLGVLLVAAGYYAGGVVGAVLGYPPSGIASIWLPTAILMAALLIASPRHWWPYLLSVVPAHLHLVATFQRPEVPLLVMLCQVGTNAGLAVLAAIAVRTVIGTPPRLDNLRNVAAFILLAGIAATAIACAVAVWLFQLTGWSTDFWLSWRQRVLGHVFPMITIPPLVLSVYFGQLVGARDAPWRSYAELAIVMIGVLAVSIPAFGWEPQGAGYMPALLLAPLPFLLWAAVRLGVGGVSLALLAVAAAALANAFLGRGPFVVQSPQVLSLQIFLVAISIPLLLLAALVEDWRRAEETLRQTQGRMGVAAASTDTGLWQYEFSTAQLWATEHCRSMFGLQADAPLTQQAFLGAVHPADRAAAVATLQAGMAKGETPRSEFRVILPGGELRWYLATAHTEFNERREPVRVSGIVRDVTPRKKAEQEAEQLSERVLVLQDEERQRIAQELHDSTAQHLLAIGLNLATLRTRMAADAETLKLFEEIDGLLEESTRELRTFTYLLHPPRLENDGLHATLQNFVDGFGRRAGLRTALTSDRTAEALPLPLQRSILRVVQEAFANVHRHASASHVSVNLKCIEKRLHLVIRDDGRGVEGSSGHRDGRPSSLGVGIAGMTARMQQFGGKLDIRSGSRGTIVHAVVPIDRP